MASLSAPTSKRKISPVFSIIGALVILVTVSVFVFLDRPAPKPRPKSPTPEATAYLPQLHLSDVHMKATENFMKQQVVEIEGQIANNGPRPISRIDLYCIFLGVDGTEIYRELVPIVGGDHTPPLPAKAGRGFRLPFDSIPDGWNQAMPNLQIAGIVFAA